MIHSPLSFLIRCNQTGEVWLFNCPDGCQQMLNASNIRLNQIHHIIITSLKIEEISGLVGLLSSLSLNDRVNSINLYGPPGLTTYVNLVRKYSKTTFKYHLQIYIHRYSLLHKYRSFYLYLYPIDIFSHNIQYIFLEQERHGRFQSYKAQMYGLNPGPIYGQLKMQHKYILPDGTIIAGKYFTNTYLEGIKISHSKENYSCRMNYELINFHNHWLINKYNYL
uniref:Ribonuclease Z n=1 Tax=Neoizziella asiatica TaxID=1077397 RepID=A0A1G4NX54_9FLOR|nr:Ribonuclease Z [Neoizziella asiatica]SCW23096.1 Ribonuclease Z [Neoizziella asiatica]